MTITNLRVLRNTLDIKLVKASCFGNSFVIYDGIGESPLEEADFAEFARQVTDPQFGIGADNFLVVQNCSADELFVINAERNYWKKSPRAEADYIFRMFEPDGEEALSCGNGLMCIANYLSEKYRVESASIMTEIPLANTNEATIGYTRSKSYGWVNLGNPRTLPAEILTRKKTDAFIGEMLTVDGLQIRFRDHDLYPYSDGNELILSGHLTFTGEPHLVFLLDDEDSPLAEFADAIFTAADENPTAGPVLQRRNEFGTWLVNHIGQYLNTHHRDRFPAGVNVNFAREYQNGSSIEFRCYERGVFKETLACGTGAIAVAYIMRQFRGHTEAGQVILPHRCRWHKPHAIMAVNYSAEGWILEGQPDIVAEIDFRFEQPPVDSEYLRRSQANPR